MTKKIIALMAVVSIIFVCTFAACDKGTYTNPATGNKYELVTDENGEKILADDGELLVYATDDKGRKITDENGEYVTEKHGFIGQIEEDGVVEDFAYYLTLPEGWKTTDDKGKFENAATGQNVYIHIGDVETYEKAYNLSEEDIDPNIEYEESITFIDGAERPKRIVATTDDGYSVFVVFENSDNWYTILFNDPHSENAEDAKKACDEFCKNLTFKPYTYYPKESSNIIVVE